MRKNIYLTEEDVILLAKLKVKYQTNDSEIYRLGLGTLLGMDAHVSKNPVMQEEEPEVIHTPIERRAFPKEKDRLKK